MVALVLMAGAPARADAVCRPTALGAVACVGARPKPRPVDPGAPPVQAIDRVRAKESSGDAGPTFIPARKTRGLGTIITDTGPGRCRPDTLGNLRCG